MSKNTIRRNAGTRAGNTRPDPSSKLILALRRDSIVDDLRKVGLSGHSLHSLEAKYLPNVIHNDEQIGAAIYGYHEDGFAMLIATDQRVIFLDKKPLFVNEDEITYSVVSGVACYHTMLGTTVTLHTKVRDYKFFSLKPKPAQIFADYIEDRCLSSKIEEDEDDETYIYSRTSQGDR